MTRLVVVSRNAALPFALNSAGHEVVAVDDQSDVRWSEYVAFAEVVLLDLGDAAVCQLVVDDLTASAIDPIRALLLSNGSSGWDEMTALKRPGVDVLPLPLTMPRLAMALESLLHGPPLSHVPAPPGPAPVVEAVSVEALPEPGAGGDATEDPLPDPQIDEQVVDALVAPLPLQAAPPSALGLIEPEPDPEPRDELPPLPSASELDAASWAVPTAVASVLVVPPVGPPPPAVEPLRAAAAELDEQLLDGPAPSPEAESESESEAEADELKELDDVRELEAPVVATVVKGAAVERPVPHVISAVRALTFAVDQLDSVADTAQVVLSEALQVVPASAGALLVRDGVEWRVAAGEGLRPLEHRIRLDPEHWLVTEVSTSWHGVLISGGEGQWSQLFGAPLSSRAHLLAAPQPPLGAILMLARDDEQFSEDDLQALVPLNEEAGHLLSDAVDVRRLARALRPFCDDED
jgi:hypothetical protein